MKPLYIERATGVPYRLVSVVGDCIVYEPYQQGTKLFTLDRATWDQRFVQLQGVEL